MNVSEVTQFVSGVVGLLAAAISLATALIAHAASGRRIVPEDNRPGTPLPRLFSPKAVVKGWISYFLCCAFGMIIFSAVFVAWVEGNLWFVPQPPQQYGFQPPQPAIAQPQVDALYEFFMRSTIGGMTMGAIVLLASMRASYVAARQAKVFRLTHGFLAVGSFYIGVGLVVYMIFANFSTQYPADWQILEPTLTGVGTLLGGILGAED